MSLSSEKKEIDSIINGLLDKLSLTMKSQQGRPGIVLRNRIGDLRSSYMIDLDEGTFNSKLLGCFTAAREAKVNLSSLVNVRSWLFSQAPIGEISQVIVQIAVGYCLSAESRMITDIEFNSRNDVDAMIVTMKTAFDVARELAADAPNSSSYQQLIYLAGSLTSYLANTARPLPQMVAFSLASILPALALSNQIYYTAERWEELVLENKVVHPAFCPRVVVGLAR